MTSSSLRILGVAMVVAVILPGRPAVGQGLLHKHVHRPLGVPLALPGQQAVSAAATASAAGQTTVVGVDGSVAAAGTGGATGSSPGGLATVAIQPGADVTIASPPIDPGGAVGDGIVCVMPLPDGQPGHPHVFHKLVPGAIAGGPGTPVAIDGAPLPDVGVVDPGLGEAVSIMPLVDAPLDSTDVVAISAFAAAPAGTAVRHGDHGLMMAQVTAAGARGPAVADAARGAGGQMRLGGLPNRAAGMRADAVPGGPGHARAAAGGSASATAPGPGVTKAAATDGPVRQASAATNVARAGAGQARGPAQAAAEPRWRDRLRFAWPTTK